MVVEGVTEWRHQCGRYELRREGQHVDDVTAGVNQAELNMAGRRRKAQILKHLGRCSGAAAHARVAACWYFTEAITVNFNVFEDHSP